MTTTPNSSFKFSDLSAGMEEIIRLDKEGFHYRGQFIADAGEAHRLMVEYLKQNIQPEPEGLPAGYIDAEHTGHNREMLEVFYRACRSEGGTAGEIHLRGLHAVLARWGRPAIEP